MISVGRVANLSVAAGRLTDFVSCITKLALDRICGYICLANVHMVATATRDRSLEEVLQKAILAAPDGMPLLWLLKRQGFISAERIAGSDLTLKICEAAARERIGVCFYGGNPQTTARLKGSLLQKFPELIVAHYESPPLLPEKPEVDMDVVGRIRNSGARIVFVGLGCPKQEFWMSAYSPHLPTILIGVGAAFDFLAGTMKRAPAWMQKAGLEWLHRLLKEPLRLWKRYLLTNTLFVIIALKAILKGPNRPSA